ncbi:MAG: DegT/DnrJ/EryC1/StrS family aminotransferase [Candidatus Omnitrophica bacterium]|nr:DegT/DnrJ/EryC1/StrS family aminotransferase [Candidatus Omnitrophota bacterium]
MSDKNMIQLFSNSLGKKELDAVKRVFSSKWVGRGHECRSFENEFGAMVSSRNVLLLNNCTSGIYLALRLLGVGKNDEVIIATVNFVAVANAVIDAGAKPVFADVDRRYFNIMPGDIERLKTRRTKAVIILHYGGHPVDYDGLSAACGKGICVIEDAANAIVSKYKNKNCGTLGDAGLFSFDAMKPLCMTDGGVLILRDSNIFEDAKSMRYLGFPEKSASGIDSMRNRKARWWEFDLKHTSGRFISNDCAAAIGRVQLKRLPGFIKRRKNIWEFYQKELGNIPGIETPPEPLPDTETSYYMYWIKMKRGRDKLAGYLVRKNIYCTFRYFPLHMVPYYGYKLRLPNAENINNTALNIPLHQNLTDKEAHYVVECIKDFFKK